MNTEKRIVCNKNILITGAGGFLGSVLMEHFSGAFPAPSVRIEETEKDEETALKIKALAEENNISVIINTAAISDIGKCEKNPDASYRANVLLPIMLAKLSEELGIKLICFSSDQVYAGAKENGPYKEDCAAPESIYGAHKLEMEKRVLKICPDAVILRAEWMYDFVSPKPNYYLNILDSDCPAAFSRKQFRGLTYAKEAAAQMEKVFYLPGGVYNFGSETEMSMYEITEAFIKYSGAEKKLTEGSQRHNLWMDTQKAGSYGIEFSDVLEGLKRCYSDNEKMNCKAERIILSKENVHSMDDVYNILSEKLGFPEHFGKNLDALFDCLWEVKQNTVITVKDKDYLCMNTEKFSTFLRVLEDASEENSHINAIIE